MGDIMAWQGKMLLDCEPKSTKSHILFLTLSQHHYLPNVKAAIQNSNKTMHFLQLTVKNENYLYFLSMEYLILNKEQL